MKFLFTLALTATVFLSLDHSHAALPKKTVKLHPYCNSIAKINAEAPRSNFLESGTPDLVLISKSQRRMYLMKGSKTLYTYPVTFGDGFKDGAKIQEGDGRTPEGIYSITHKNPNSSYHLSLGVSYPNQTDKDYAKKYKLQPGGDIMIHGLPNWLGKKAEGITFANMFNSNNWTAGCIATRNDIVRFVYKTVPVKTAIAICPR